MAGSTARGVCVDRAVLGRVRLLRRCCLRRLRHACGSCPLVPFSLASVLRKVSVMLKDRSCFCPRQSRQQTPPDTSASLQACTHVTAYQTPRACLYACVMTCYAVVCRDIRACLYMCAIQACTYVMACQHVTAHEHVTPYMLCAPCIAGLTCWLRVSVSCLPVLPPGLDSRSCWLSVR